MTCLHSPSSGAKFRVVTAPDAAPTAPPTFLFTDLEASTRTWEREPEAMERWLACHDRLVTAAIVANRGRVFKHTGDGLCATFVSAADGARAARDIQLALAVAGEARVGRLRTRIAVHTGEARERGGDFYGPTLNPCALEAALARELARPHDGARADAAVGLKRIEAWRTYS